MTQVDMRHLNHLGTVAQEDVKEVQRKEQTYRGSWKRRGGAGAFMMLARKWDRLEGILEGQAGWDIFAAMLADPQGADGSALAEVRDLRRYLLLVEAEVLSRLAAQPPAEMLDIESGVPRRVPLTSMGSTLADDLGRPGTPEDGGHHAPRPSPQHSTAGRPEDGEEVRPTGWPSIQVGRWFNVNRAAVAPERRGHLPTLRPEKNGMEHAMLPAWYQPMYEWVESENKYRLRAQYLEHWT